VGPAAGQEADEGGGLGARRPYRARRAGGRLTAGTTLPLPEGAWWDWEVRHYDGSRLTLVAGHDLTYHHGLEVVFTDTVYVRCPMAFSDPEFREPTPGERAEIARLVGGEPPVLVAFVADGGGMEPVSCLIAAEAWAVRQGTFRRSVPE
jgi:hypothetical protein